MAKIIRDEIWYTPEELGPMIGKDPDYLRELARGRRGKTLPAEKVGRRWYFHHATVVKHLKIKTTRKGSGALRELSKKLGV